FAVWLDPGSDWRRRYAGWGAMRKLEYVDRIARELRDVPPPRATGETDITVDEMEQTVEDFYREVHVDETPIVDNLALDTDLADIFDKRVGEPAAVLLAADRRVIVDKVHYWTGVRRTLVRELVHAIERRLGELALTGTHRQMTELTIYITALAMTFLTGSKPLRLRRPR
ncbi:MAG TPA: hypothetical protein VN181_16150, partial [Thermoanaerobaculia bacterium]|nr:hypothetical protein [Thermoanaerobaculia bacterium]